MENNNNTNDFDLQYAKLKLRNEEKINNIKSWLVQKIPVITALAIVIFWIFYGMVEIYPSGLSLTDRVTLTVITCALAVFYCSLLAHTGFDSARQTIVYTKAENEYEEIQKKGIGKRKQIERYALEKAESNLKDLRTTNLEGVGLKYENIFDESGELIALDFATNKYNKKTNKYGYRHSQRKMIKKCATLRVIMPNLFGSMSSKFFGLKAEVTQRDYEVRSNTTNAIFRIVINIFSVGIMFRYVGINIGSMIYAFLQIVLWTASAVSQRLKNFAFVTNKLVPQMKDKTLCIQGYLDLSDTDKLKYEDKIENELEVKIIDNKEIVENGK